MAADALAPYVARASAAMILTQSPRNVVIAQVEMINLYLQLMCLTSNNHNGRNPGLHNTCCLVYSCYMRV